jgi:hypothetical protein
MLRGDKEDGLRLSLIVALQNVPGELEAGASSYGYV